MRAEVHVERRDETGGQVVLGCANGDARRDRCDRLVADVLVDQIARLPQGRRVHARLPAEAVERLDE